MANSAKLEAGTVIGGDFRIVEPLGAGGMGAVYVAEQLSTGKKRALKVMHEGLATDDKQRERFVREAKAGSLIDSSHVVEVIGAGVDDDGHPWLAMELLRGSDMADYLREHGPQSPAELEEIFEQLCHALAGAHASGLVHRDIKPENIFMARTRGAREAHVVKVLDFGIAKLADHTRTTKTAAIGSPTWMAPEQAEPEIGITPATDVWALGLLAYWLITGRFYWKNAGREVVSMHAIMKEILLDPVVLASKRAEEQGVAECLPAGFDDWFERCVHREPRARYADAGAAFEGLRAMLAGQPLETMSAAGVSDPAAVESSEMSTQAFIDGSDLSTEEIPLSERRSAETVPEAGLERPPTSETGEPSVVETPPPAPSKRRTRVLVVAGVALGMAVVGGLLRGMWNEPSPPPSVGVESVESVESVPVESVEPPGEPEPVAPPTPTTPPELNSPFADKPEPAPARPRPAAMGAAAKASASAEVTLPPFNRHAAQTALNIRVRTIKLMCKGRDGPSSITATVTFQPTGQVSNVAMERKVSFTSLGQCVRINARQTRIRPFSGEPESMPLSVTF